MLMEEAYRIFEARCVNALARREHSRFELAQKGGEFAPEVVCAVLDELAEKNWQNDARFAASYVRHKSARGNGRKKIAQALKNRGIDSALAQQALEEVDWFALAKRVYQRKYAKPLPSAFLARQKEQARRLRFMAQRGFSFAEIAYAEQAEAEDDE